MTPVRLRVKELREAKDYGLRELARIAGVQHQTISKIESGATSRIDLDVLDRLAKALGVDPGLLVVRTPAKRSR